jgi:hypothetical protein
VAVPRIWAGVDAGKTHHHCVVIDADGHRMLSRRVANDEPDLLALISDVLDISDGDQTTWAIDLADGGAALMIGLLADHGRRLLHIPGRTVNRAASGYRGAGRTDAKDAAIIADQARMRRDLHPMRADDELVVELRLLTARRTDLVHDRTRTISRLRELLTGIFPALERALDLTNAGPPVLLTGYQTLAALRRLGRTRLEAWPRHRKVRGAAQLAQAAAQLAERQHTSLPGIGTVLGAEFPAATGGDMDAFGSSDRLAGLAPAPRDSGRIHGNLHRPQRYHRGLNRVFYTSVLISIQRNPDSRAFYDRKRAEGKRHTQAVLALARRRVNVLWALLRDGRCHQPAPPVPAAA